MEIPNVHDFRDIAKVRVVGYHRDRSQQDEVNEALSLGWKLLLIQPGEDSASFVLGWSGPETAPQTKWEKQISQYAGIGRVR